jgi:alkanesulfonate monooxygenase SsuD/methylene tetrahydromethanopterin reductase-like flavin-dependent oxidoreductase (luciferase family)
MTTLHNTFGIAARNFTTYPEMPDGKALVEYGVKMEEMGFDSLWVWDHILLGVEPSFPVFDSLTLLTAIAARTKKIKLSTGVLVLPLRNPVVLAKQLSSIDQLSDGRLLMAFAAGWYRREFDAVGVPFEQRGKIMDENLEILKRFWTPVLIGGYVDVVLKRAAVAGDGWLTYFYRPESFAKSWEKVRNFAKEAGKDPDTLMNGAQLPIMIGKSRAAVESQMMEWLGKEWDYAAWSDSTKDSAIIGTVDECVAQLKEHLAAGVQKLIFVPYKYEMSQIQIIAEQIIPRLRDFRK